jgi:hypothetical protein
MSKQCAKAERAIDTAVRRTRMWHSNSAHRQRYSLRKVAASCVPRSKKSTHEDRAVLEQQAVLCSIQFTAELLLPRALRRSKRKCLFRSATVIFKNVKTEQFCFISFFLLQPW